MIRSPYGRFESKALEEDWDLFTCRLSHSRVLHYVSIFTLVFASAFSLAPRVFRSDKNITAPLHFGFFQLHTHPNDLVLCNLEVTWPNGKHDDNRAMPMVLSLWARGDQC